MRSRRFGFEREPGLGEEPVDEGAPVLDAFEPVLDDRGELVCVGDEVAVVVSIACGHDASYPFKTIRAGEGPVITGECGAGYYLSAVEKGGEPAETRVGDGAAELGLHDGDTVRREDFEPLYGQFLDPRDPSGRAYLGSPPRVNTELAAIGGCIRTGKRAPRHFEGTAAGLPRLIGHSVAGFWRRPGEWGAPWACK